MCEIHAVVLFNDNNNGDKLTCSVTFNNALVGHNLSFCRQNLLSALFHYTSFNEINSEFLPLEYDVQIQRRYPTRRLTQAYGQFAELSLSVSAQMRGKTPSPEWPLSVDGNVRLYPLTPQILPTLDLYLLSADWFRAFHDRFFVFILLVVFCCSFFITLAFFEVACKTSWLLSALLERTLIYIVGLSSSSSSSCRPL